jgi:putative ubiquitin-RnfH superfamily antitoxin RatB of RatAB toxin-antitoxin module
MAIHRFKTVEITYALPHRQFLESLKTEYASTIESILRDAMLFKEFPELNINTLSVGIFDKKAALTDVPNDGDRICIYRPLTIDPMDARRLRAQRQKTKPIAKRQKATV